jgi:hypothetical protein
MANWYVSREAVKAAAQITGSSQNTRIDRINEAVARMLDSSTRRFFIPRTETRLYRWPRRSISNSSILWLDQDLLSVTTLQTKAQNSSPTTIASSDFFLEPVNESVYNRIEIDLSSTAAFEAGNTPQRSISVTGVWGYSQDTQSAGTVSSGLSSDATATSMVCSDASKVDVGDTLLIESEQVFVSERTNAANGSDLLDGALTASMAEVAITVDNGGLYAAGEVILVDSERMQVESITSNVLTVIRAYDGSVLATHLNNAAVHVFRTLTIERGVNGTTAATHANSTTITRYRPPLDIMNLCLAEAIATGAQEGAGWGRSVGTGDAATELTGRELGDLRNRVIMSYRRMREDTI